VKNVKRRFARRIPNAARYINTGMAVVLIGFGVYHYTQPNAAWRSGTIESIAALLLLAAAYLVPPKAAIIINGALAVILCGLGIRHLAIGGGWVSGSIEELFACLLVIGAVIISKKQKTNR
jgi:threonine/homoserine/homoserine lactone efflux protein